MLVFSNKFPPSCLFFMKLTTGVLSEFEWLYPTNKVASNISKTITYTTHYKPLRRVQCIEYF